MIPRWHHKYTPPITLQRIPNCVWSLKAPSGREEPICHGIRYHEAPATQNRSLEGPTSHDINFSEAPISENRVFQGNNGGCFQEPYVGCSGVPLGVLRGTLDRGPLKHRIGSCIWDNVKDPIRSFRAPFVLRVYNTKNHTRQDRRTKVGKIVSQRQYI